MKISVTFEGETTAEVVKDMLGYIKNLGEFTVAFVKNDGIEGEGVEDGAHNGEVEEVCPSGHEGVQGVQV